MLYFKIQLCNSVILSLCLYSEQNRFQNNRLKQSKTPQTLEEKR